MSKRLPENWPRPKADSGASLAPCWIPFGSQYGAKMGALIGALTFTCSMFLCVCLLAYQKVIKNIQNDIQHYIAFVVFGPLFDKIMYDHFVDLQNKSMTCCRCIIEDCNITAQKHSFVALLRPATLLLLLPIKFWVLLHLLKSANSIILKGG